MRPPSQETTKRTAVRVAAECAKAPPSGGVRFQVRWICHSMQITSVHTGLTTISPAIPKVVESTPTSRRCRTGLCTVGQVPNSCPYSPIPRYDWLTSARRLPHRPRSAPPGRRLQEDLVLGGDPVGLLTRFHPPLERYGSPSVLRKAGRRKLVEVIRPKAPRMAKRLIDDVFDALGEQTVVDAGRQSPDQPTARGTAELRIAASGH